MDKSYKKEILNVPNYITMGRMIAVPVVMFLLTFVNDEKGPTFVNRYFSFATAWVFIVAMLSDMVDGWYARKYNVVSTFGKFLDPLADKMLFVVTMIMLIPMGRIPAWLVVLFLVREIAITALRGIAASEGIVIAASHWGKYKSAFVTCATAGLLIHYKAWGVDWRMAAWVMMWPALVLSVGSGIHYVMGFIKEIKKTVE
ncbi:CDP-diacylglycerol--glycerol-3-phosphate 3-phosphatidyltransferase [bacterium]|nr:CDP-diacylglycerol--glycerol-3-phosphate 3-phosphatidyltransferase [bacterium]